MRKLRARKVKPHQQQGQQISSLTLVSREFRKQRVGHFFANTTKLLIQLSCLDVKTDMDLLTLSTLDHKKEMAMRFMQNHGVIHQLRLCSNGHQMTLSTV